MTRPTALVFAMPPVGHFQRVRALLPGMVEAGLDVVVMTDERFRDAVESCGASFDDLFGRYPLDDVDPESTPPPVRFVSYAGRYAREIISDAAALTPALVVYDTFAVIGRVVASALDIPFVNVCAGHDRRPGRVVDGYRRDPRLSVSAACHRAIASLHELGLDDVTPLSWADGVSPYLNVYCEPPAFLLAEGRAAFEPIAFYGSLSPDSGPRPRADSLFRDGRDRLRVYVSLGSVGWRLFHAETRSALEAIVDALGARDDVEGVVSIGHDGVTGDELAGLRRRNVTVHAWLDQQAALEDADVFVTHHGLNSTHEAIYARVPMISYPLFADQPDLAALCQSLALAVPLVEGVRAPVGTDAVGRALAAIADRRDAMGEALDVARQWELDVIAGRPAVDRLLAELACVPAVS